MTVDAAVALGLFDSAASWCQQMQAVAVLLPGEVPTAATLARAAPARGGDLVARTRPSWALAMRSTSKRRAATPYAGLATPATVRTSTMFTLKLGRDEVVNQAVYVPLTQEKAA